MVGRTHQKEGGGSGGGDQEEEAKRDEDVDYFTYTVDEDRPNEMMRRASPSRVIRASVTGRREGNNRYSAVEDEDGGSGASRSGTFAEDLVELECDLPELLNQYKYHPLNYMFPQEIQNIGKTDEYSMYTFYSLEFE